MSKTQILADFYSQSGMNYENHLSQDDITLIFFANQFCLTINLLICGNLS